MCQGGREGGGGGGGGAEEVGGGGRGWSCEGREEEGERGWAMCSGCTQNNGLGEA